MFITGDFDLHLEITGDFDLHLEIIGDLYFRLIIAIGDIRVGSIGIDGIDITAVDFAGNTDIKIVGIGGIDDNLFLLFFIKGIPRLRFL